MRLCYGNMFSRLHFPRPSGFRRSFLFDFTLAFALVALALIFLTGFALSRFLGNDIRAKTIDDVALFTQQVTAAQISHNLTAEQLNQPLEGEGLQAFDRFIDNTILAPPILRVNVWNAQGTVIYSSYGPLTGQSFPLNEHLQTAMSGETEAEVEGEEGAEGEGLEGYHVVEVYTPIKLEGGRIVGAFEIYRDYGPIASYVASVQKTLSIGIAAALSALYLILVFVVRRGSDLIGRQQLDLRARAEELKYLAYHDSVTNLPNRTLLKDRLTVAVAQARRSGQTVSVMFLDLDRFKAVNDSLGHAMGDQLLKSVGEQLTRLVRDGDTVARVGGDEFALLLPAVARPEDAVEVAQRVLDHLRRPRALAGRELHVTTSIGIAFYPSDGDDAETLLRNADTAMYEGKARGRDKFELFTPAMSAQIVERLALENDLHTALKREEFVVHYQPQVDASAGQIVSMEALVRWRHPNRGLLLPGDFIPIAEDTGLILPIGEWVLRTACCELKRLMDAGCPPIPVAVNLSARQFRQPNLVEMVTMALRDSGLPARCLRLEITEGAVMDDVEFTIAVLREFRRMGIAVSIDDFGTGYSSLDYLKRFPIDEVKIDCSFVQDITADADDAAIVNAIISLVHSLNLRVVAEGVETSEQLSFLKERGCHDVQGFLFAQAVPLNEIQGLLRKGMLDPIQDAAT